MHGARNKMMGSQSIPLALTKLTATWKFDISYVVGKIGSKERAVVFSFADYRIVLQTRAETERNCYHYF